MTSERCTSMYPLMVVLVVLLILVLIGVIPVH